MKNDVYILLDRSYSMISRWGEVIPALNTYVDALEAKGTRVTVAIFDTGGVDYLRDRVKRKEWQPISTDEASPRGGTPLYDAIGNIHGRMVKNDRKRSTLVIMTDGEENSSQEMTKKSAKKIIDECKSRDWDVTFIGANFDAFGESSHIGIGSGQTLNVSDGNYQSAMSALAARTTAYNSTCDNTLTFSDEDRKVAGMS